MNNRCFIQINKYTWTEYFDIAEHGAKLQNTHNRGVRRVSERVAWLVWQRFSFKNFVNGEIWAHHIRQSNQRLESITETKVNKTSLDFHQISTKVWTFWKVLIFISKFAAHQYLLCRNGTRQKSVSRIYFFLSKRIQATTLM